MDTDDNNRISSNSFLSRTMVVQCTVNASMQVQFLPQELVVTWGHGITVITTDCRSVNRSSILRGPVKSKLSSTVERAADNG